MGLTTASVHMYVGPAEDANGAFASACEPIGYKPFETRDVEDCDLVAVSSGRWLTFLDLANAGIATHELTQLAKRVSANAKCPVIVTSVYDSDDFGYVIFNRGRQFDAFATNEELIPVSSPKSYPKKRAERWSRLFHAALTSDDVKSIINPSGTFADDQLLAMSQLIGLPAEQAVLTPSELIAKGSGFFGYRKRTGSSTIQQHLGDLPEVKTIESLVGYQETISFELQAPRAEVSNPRVELSGTAIEQGLVQLRKAGGLWHCGVKHVTSGGAQQFEGEGMSPDTVKIDVSFSSLHADAFAHAPSDNVTLYLWVCLDSIKEGEGEIGCRFSPNSQAADSIELKPRVTMTVGPKADWVPLRAAEGWFEQQAVKTLNQPTVLAVVSILEDRPASCDRLRRQIEHWFGAHDWPDACTIAAKYEGQMHPETLHVPRKKSSFAVVDVGQSKKWERWFARPEKLQSLVLKIHNSDGMPLAGASIQRTSEEDDPIEGTIQFALWIGTKVNELDKQGIDVARRKLVETIDDHFEPLAGIQAWLVHWNWVPLFDLAEERNNTPYEDAGNLDSLKAVPSDFTQATWCRRYLRAVGDYVWLSESLLKGVHREALVKVAGQTPVGETARRFRLRDQLRLNQMEEALSPIIPGEV